MPRPPLLVSMCPMNLDIAGMFEIPSRSVKNCVIRELIP